MEAGLFDRIAPVYDRMNRILSLGMDLRWRRVAACAAAALRTERGAGAPADILDLAAGTGDFAIALARRFPSARVCCADISAPMLEIARRKAAAAGMAGRFSFRTSPADALEPFAGRFDIVSCAFGFRNFPSPRAALAGCARALKPGGMLAVLEFTRPRCAAARLGLSAWLRAASLAAGRRHGADYAYLRRSIMSTFTAREFAAMAESVLGGKVSSRLLFPACRLFLAQAAAPQKQ